MLSLGPLPISECYFAGEGHAGIAAGKGCIIVLHIPTLDVWSLSPFGCGRSLLLARLINGRMIPAQLEGQVEALYSHATRNCGGVLNPMYPESDIVAKDLSRRNAEASSPAFPRTQTPDQERALATP
jgi:hypothetical protein